MTEEEKKAAEAAALAVAEANKALEEVDMIAEKDAKIAKLSEDLENYKAVALKRLGKLPGDADFLAGGDDDKKELSVGEQIKIALFEKEIESEKLAKDKEVNNLKNKVSELTLALKNRPESSLGGDSGSVVEVKDNVLTTGQIEELKKRATRLGVDPDKFVESAKKNLAAHR